MINNVRRIVGQPINEVQKDFFDNIEEDSNIGLYSGIVVNNNDPDKQGKCRIRVYGIFGNDVPDNDLPWALPDFSFVGSLVGSFVVPPVGAIVKVYFDHGDIYLPHYTTKAVVSSRQPTQKNINYPDNMVIYETDEGDYFTINRKTLLTTFHHNSGSEITFEKNGNVNVKVVKKELNGGNETHIVDGNITMETTSKPNSVITLKTAAGGKIEIDSINGDVSIEQGVLGSIYLGGKSKAVIPCPDLPACLVTGGPLATKTLIPGMAVKVP